MKFPKVSPPWLNIQKRNSRDGLQESLDSVVHSIVKFWNSKKGVFLIRHKNFAILEAVFYFSDCSIQILYFPFKDIF